MDIAPSVEVDSPRPRLPLVSPFTLSNSSFSSPASPSSSPRSRRSEQRVIDGKLWRQVALPANMYRNSIVSRAWEHGAEYLNINQPHHPHRWICDYCDAFITLNSSRNTANATRHLRSNHKLALKRQQSEIEEEEQAQINEEEQEEEEELLSQHESRQQSVVSSRRSQSHFSTLVTTVQVERFRQLLIQWIIQAQIPYSCVENAQFRNLLLYLAPSLQQYLVRSHSTITRWIKDDYLDARKHLQLVLATAKSQVHLSFDAWTSPSSAPLIGICAHFLGNDLLLKNALLGLKWIEGAHTGETLGRLIAEVIEELGIADKVGVYVADNASNMDSAIAYLVNRFYPDESSEESPRRSRCLGHIINLAAQSFLLGNNCEAFEDEVNLAELQTARDWRQLAIEQAKWRQKGPIGKFHNVIKWIRSSSQRRQKLSEVILTIIAEKIAQSECITS
jgi:hypothetical protein